MAFIHLYVCSLGTQKNSLRILTTTTKMVLPVLLRSISGLRKHFDFFFKMSHEKPSILTRSKKFSTFLQLGALTTTTMIHMVPAVHFRSFTALRKNFKCRTKFFFARGRKMS